MEQKTARVFMFLSFLCSRDPGGQVGIYANGHSAGNPTRDNALKSIFVRFKEQYCIGLV